jgi:ABC-type polysaccharide/polyol phosphate export permease
MKARPYGNTGIPYIWFLLSSFFFWLAFSEGLMRSSTIIVENAEIIKKVSFSNIVLPVATTLSSYLSPMIGFLLFIIVYSLVIAFNVSIILVIPVLLVQIVFSAGLGILFSALLPYIRDIGQVLSYILQGLFFMSPIIYSIEAIPDKFRILFYMNPITYFAASYQRMILMGEAPTFFHITVICLLAVVSLSAGIVIFRKLNEGFADVL